MVYILTFARSGSQKLVDFAKFIENCENIVFSLVSLGGKEQ